MPRVPLPRFIFLTCRRGRISPRGGGGAPARLASQEEEWDRSPVRPATPSAAALPLSCRPVTDSGQAVLGAQILAARAYCSPWLCVCVCFAGFPLCLVTYILKTSTSGYKCCDLVIQHY